ncbi:hypothetical protein NDU88_001261 [Pleurodeles waltl]|uniref:Uncharacterized protein n=1 Tax=Pleurodeles waltl TaxID=8319 RepID=A0AAV7TIN0_PLEWA|nr:hypothetical protein NDU88_001261 [Pleurodeles waltl]
MLKRANVKAGSTLLGDNAAITAKGSKAMTEPKSSKEQNKHKLTKGELNILLRGTDKHAQQTFLGPDGYGVPKAMTFRQAITAKYYKARGSMENCILRTFKRKKSGRTTKRFLDLPLLVVRRTTAMH